MITVLDLFLMIAGLVFFSFPIVQWALGVIKEESSKYHSWRWFRPHCGVKVR